MWGATAGVVVDGGDTTATVGVQQACRRGRDRVREVKTLYFLFFVYRRWDTRGWGGHKKRWRNNHMGGCVRTHHQNGNSEWMCGSCGSGNGVFRKRRDVEA